MNFTRICPLVGLVALFAAFSLAQADEKSPEEVLNEKGIKRVGDHLAIAEEVDLSKMFAQASKLSRSVYLANNELAAAEKKGDQAQRLISTYLQQRRALRAQYASAKTVEEQNKIVLAMNELEDRIQLMQQDNSLNKELTDVRGKTNATREAYIEHVLNMRALADKIAQQYDKLATDPEVLAAVKQLNVDTDKEYEVVESRAFQSALRNLKKLEDTVLSETIELRANDRGDLFYISTVLAGKYPKELVLDTGSSLCCLPHAMAKSIDAEPGVDDPNIRLTLADGSVVEAKMVILPAVRVGKFTVENVECAVMPADLKQAAPILGMSFLRNFNFKVDPESAKLTMNKIDNSSSR